MTTSLVYRVLLAAFSSIFCLPSYAETAPLDFCDKGNLPIFSFREYYSDYQQPSKRKIEVWVDRSEDSFRAFLRRKGQRPRFLLGSVLNKDRVFLCEYNQNGGKALAAYFGSLSSGQLQWGSRSSAVTLSRIHFLNEVRNYGLRYENKSSVHSDPKWIENPKCEARFSFFQVYGERLTPAQTTFNSFLLSKLNWKLPWEEESLDCQKSNVARKYSVTVNQLFANDKIISSKMDYVLTDRNSVDIDTWAINFDLEKNREIMPDELISTEAQKQLLPRIRTLVAEAYGSFGRLNSLDAAGFSFTAESLVVSFPPVDEKGFYLKARTIDVPVALDEVTQVLKIDLKAPFPKN